MWDAVVTIIERRWSDRPKKRLIRAVLDLRSAMKECQRTYLAYQAPAHDSIDKRGSQKYDWSWSFLDLSLCILELDDILEIFSPETHAALRAYWNHDNIVLIYDDFFAHTARELNTTREFDVHANELQPSFEVALARLDEFIRTHFKPEEVIAHKPRKWEGGWDRIP